MSIPKQTITQLGQQEQDAITAWVKRQLARHDMSVETLAARSDLDAYYLQQSLAGKPYIGLRQWFHVAGALGYDPVDFIHEVGLLSEAGDAYIAYCQEYSEAPLGDLWRVTQDLPQLDRLVLLEFVYNKRYKRWHSH